MTISELARRTGRSCHTLRYYEREGLIPGVTRTAAGHRRYQERHVGWISLLERLRLSGMPVRVIRSYCRLIDRGDEAIAERRELLADHARAIQQKIQSLNNCLDIIRLKLDLYDGKIDRTAFWAALDGAVERARDGDRRTTGKAASAARDG